MPYIIEVTFELHENTIYFVFRHTRPHRQGQLLPHKQYSKTEGNSTNASVVDPWVHLYIETNLYDCYQNVP